MDVGLVAYPQKEAKLEIVPLRKDLLVLICHPQHPFAKLKSIKLRAVAVQKGHARLDGWQMRKSQEVRLKRLVARAQVLPDAVVLPITPSRELSVTQALLRLLDEIAPAQTPGEATAPVPSGR